MTKLYLVEDDENISELVSYALNGAGFETLSFENGSEFFKAIENECPDLVLLDIMLPGENGLAILKKLRKTMKAMPIIMLTAKGSEFDKIKGLDDGADDYITKPFSIMELIARINALLRRAKTVEAKKISYQEITLDDKKHLVTVNQKPVSLTIKEYDLLYYLLKNQELVLTREQIIETVWGYDFEGESRTIDMHIKTLRQKLGTNHIKTIRGVGYKLGA